MTDTIELRARPTAFFFRGQALHTLYLVALLAAAWGLAAPVLGDGTWLGATDTLWFALAIGIAVLHQMYTWIGWRAQLAWQTFTRLFGDADFAVFAAGFIPMLSLRPVLVWAASAADCGSLRLPPQLTLGLSILLAVPALYTAWSVVRYFGVLRAAGGDHFRRRYREMPLVQQGAFAWAPNAMYTFGFLALWSIAFYTRSQAGLVAALFQHAYVWVHYLCTEQPDMDVLYR